MSRYAIFVFILLFGGCASSGLVITQDNNVINMPHYTLMAPPDQGWFLEMGDKTFEQVYLTKSVDSAGHQMFFSINWLAADYARRPNAKQVADDYRNQELSNMQIKGVMTGMYKLEDVVMGEEYIGDNKFYTMHYANITSDATVNSSLYLYFPNETEVSIFIVAIYTDTYITTMVLQQTSYKNEFINVLESLQLTKETYP